MRTKYSFLNLAGALFGQVLGVAAQFVTRRVFIACLSQTYLGLSGLFSNILSVLSLVELGSGVAMAYSLYKPIADSDTEMIKSLMALYHKIYIAIGVIILAVGFAITPLYPVFMQEIPNIPNLTLIYWIYVVNTAISYFYSYKRTLVICDQRRYLYSLTHYGMYAFGSLLQIIVLISTQSFVWYLLCLTISTILENVVITKIADRRYPYLHDKNIARLPNAEIETLKKNISAMLMHKIGGMLVSSTDNIIISRWIGLSVVGIYSNYLLITDALSKITIQFFQAITAGVGDLLVDSDERHVKDVFDRTFFIGSGIYGACYVCMLCGFQPFIRWYAGSNYLLEFHTVVLICFNFYITGMRKAVLAFRDASATYYYDRYKAIVEAAANLFLSVILGARFGIDGVIVGTILSAVLISVWIEPYMLHKYVLRTSVRRYYFTFLRDTVITLVTGWVCYKFTGQIRMGHGLGESILRITTALICYAVIFYLLFRNTKEMAGVKKMIYKLIKGRGMRQS